MGGKTVKKTTINYMVAVSCAVLFATVVLAATIPFMVSPSVGTPSLDISDTTTPAITSEMMDFDYAWFVKYSSAACYDNEGLDEEAPIEISSVAELAAFAKLVNNVESRTFKDKYVRLALRADGYDLSPDIVGDNKKYWDPIGKNKNFWFEGVFDGRGQTIRNLYPKNSFSKQELEQNYNGLFGDPKFGSLNVINLTVISGV